MGWIRFRNPAGLIRIIAAAVSVLGACAHASAQTNGVISNQQVTVALYGTGQRDSINLSGKFEMVDNQTNEFILLAAHQGELAQLLGSYLVVRIDGGAPPAGAPAGTPGWDILMGDDALGTFTRPPTNLNDRVYAVWQTIPAGTQGGLPLIEVVTEITPIGDMAQFRFTVTNRDSQAHTVGLKFVQDFQLNGFFSTSSDPILNEGPVIPSAGAQICTETELRGAQVPARWIRTHRTLVTNPSATAPDAFRYNSVGAILRPPNAPPTFIPPDRLVFGGVVQISKTPAERDAHLLWPDPPFGLPDFDFCRDPWDVAGAVVWEPRLFSPGQSQAFTTYFGRGHANMDFEGPLAVGVDAPFSVVFNPNAAPAKQFTPNPVTITAYLQNLSLVGLTNVQATLTPPPGFALAQGESLVKQVGSLASFASTTVSWNLVPNGSASGLQTYSVAFSAGPGTIGKSVTGQIELPVFTTGLPVTLSNPTASSPGTANTLFVNMVAFPFNFVSASPQSALTVKDDTGRTLRYDLGEFGLLRWNAAAERYENVSSIRPGEAYWLILQRPAAAACTQITVTLDLNETVATDVTGAAEIALQPGWNQVGNPFQYQIRWADVVVVSTDAADPNRLRPLSVEEAAQRGLISPTIYAYDPRTCNYTAPIIGINTELTPVRGFWVKSLRQGVRLLFNPTTGRAARTREAALPGPTGANGWTFGLVATSSGTVSGWNSLGVDSGARDGFDLQDAERPPLVAPKLSVTFVRPDWPGGRSAAYARDLQAADGGRKQWEVLVSTPEENADVTLAWPEAARVPRSYELTIIDRSTGSRRSMRQTSSLAFNTGKSGMRAFTIVAEPRRAGALQITGLAVRPAGRGAGAAIAFTASRDASVQVRILGASGSVVRTLTTRAAGAGPTQLTWDQRDSRGVAVPSGAYTIEVKGVTDDGQSARAVSPYLVVR